MFSREAKVQKKKFSENPQQQSFMNKKKWFIVISVSLLCIVLIALALVFVIGVGKNDFSSIWPRMGEGAQAFPWVVVLVLALFLPKILIINFPILVRLKSLGYKVGFWENLMFNFSFAFLSAISPGTVLTDPYVMFWIKSNGATNAEAYSVVATNGFMCQIAQILVTVPSFIIISTEFHMLNTWESQAVYWLMIVGLCIDMGWASLFLTISYSKKVAYTLSLLFNKVKKFFHLKYHTKEQTKKKYLKESYTVELSKSLMKNWKATSIIFCSWVSNEIIMYVLMCLCVQWLMPKGVYCNFASIFNCANLAITANKMLPIPGGNISIEWSLTTLISKVGHLPSDLDPKTTSDQSVFIFRLFTSYLPAAIGVFVFLWYTYYQKRTYFKKQKLGEEVRKNIIGEQSSVA